ncbi:hypothetical protein Tco_0251709 [Tanacetum coccineum]
MPLKCCPEGMDPYVGVVTQRTEMDMHDLMIVGFRKSGERIGKDELVCITVEGKTVLKCALYYGFRMQSPAPAPTTRQIYRNHVLNPVIVSVLPTKTCTVSKRTVRRAEHYVFQCNVEVNYGVITGVSDDLFCVNTSDDVCDVDSHGQSTKGDLNLKYGNPATLCLLGVGFMPHIFDVKAGEVDTSYRAMWDTAYWGFLRVRTTFDIFQNLHILYPLNTAYRSSLDTAYWIMFLRGL